MGCSVPSGFHTAMPLFGRRSNNSNDTYKTTLERKLYLARESPDPSFDLSDCGLKTVPSGIFSLCKVFRKESLNLENNFLTGIEDGGSVKDLSELKVLNLNKNKLHKWLGDISCLMNLRELHLRSNKLKNIPYGLERLCLLQILDVSDNGIKNIPESIGDLKRLRKLCLKGNPNLKILPKELCLATNLKVVELDSDNFNYPSSEIVCSGTDSIMIFLCKQLGIDYEAPADILDEDSLDGTPYTVLSPTEYDKSLKGEFSNWKSQDENLQQLENEMHEASKRQKEKFLLEYTQDQMKLDNELSKLQHERDNERTKLIRQIQDEESSTEKIIGELLGLNALNPQRIQQSLEHDERELDRLLEICRANYTNLKKVDTLNAMQSLLEEECSYERSLKSYGESQSEVQRSFLLEELNAKRQLGNALKTRGEEQSGLVERLLKDENVQRAVVGTLLEKCDARTWGLVQEINLVQSQLAKLSVIELDRRKLETQDNVDTLADQRIRLTFLLVDLLDQQEVRRSQLVQTLQTMERDSKTSADFWLIRYQQLLDSIPDIAISTQRMVDPMFANYLLQEGVIHCLPFLVQWISSKEQLETLNDDMLEERGVKLTSDREAILRAVQLYVEESDAAELKIDNWESTKPSAPVKQESSDSGEIRVEKTPLTYVDNLTAECVVCMEENCAVVFVPCGHLCCCVKCSDSIEQSCPMCRGDIERKIRVIQS